jgi:hypothetical protein
MFLLKRRMPEKYGEPKKSESPFRPPPGSTTTMTQVTSVKVENYSDDDLETLRLLLEKGGVHLPPPRLKERSSLEIAERERFESTRGQKSAPL